MEINIQSITKLSQDLLKSVNDLDLNIKNLTNCVNSIEQFWTGIDSKAYISAMQERNIKELKKAKDILQEYEKFLEETPKIFQMLDEVYASKSIG